MLGKAKLPFFLGCCIGQKLSKRGVMSVAVPTWARLDESEDRMRKLVWLLIVVSLNGSPVLAQKVEVFGGYQFTHLQPAYNASGWNASISGNFKHVLGITADFSGAYRSNVDFYSYTFGPTLTARLPVVQPFVHALFGVATLKSGEISTSGFAMYVGGGLDLGLRKGIGLRLFQGDWLNTNFNDVSRNKNGRFSTGLVLKF
jgi:hypothetical protein